jgi:hypothetical protein
MSILPSAKKGIPVSKVASTPTSTPTELFHVPTVDFLYSYSISSSESASFEELSILLTKLIIGSDFVIEAFGKSYSIFTISFFRIGSPRLRLLVESITFVPFQPK